MSTFILMVLLLLSLYLSISTVAIVLIVAALLASTIGYYIHFKEFFSMRDRGQRTLSVLLSLYGSLILTLLCAYYYTQDEPLSLDYALVFLFGFSSLRSWFTAAFPGISSSVINEVKKGFRTHHPKAFRILVMSIILLL